MNIDQLAIKNNTDKSSLDHNYTKFYQTYFDKYVNNPKKILELGIYTTTNSVDLETSGASLKTWSEYFPESKVYGLDLSDFSVLDNNYKNIHTLPCNTEIRNNGDAYKLQNPWLVEIFTNPKYNFIGGNFGLEEITDKFGSDFDIIIDDGPHTMSGQQIFLGYMFKHLKSGGIFVIEDLCTSDINKWGPSYNSYPMTDKTTLWMINYYIKHKKIITDFMLEDEIKYLEDNISEMYLETANNSEIAFIIKK
jgi:demethylmacrocin O-methyltransferase